MTIAFRSGIVKPSKTSLKNLPGVVVAFEGKTSIPSEVSSQGTKIPYVTDDSPRKLDLTQDASPLLRPVLDLVSFPGRRAIGFTNNTNLSVFLNPATRARTFGFTFFVPPGTTVRQVLACQSSDPVNATPAYRIYAG